MNISSIITAFVLLLILGAAVCLSLRRKRKNPACGGACGCCPHTKSSLACGEAEKQASTSAPATPVHFRKNT